LIKKNLSFIQHMTLLHYPWRQTKPLRLQMSIDPTMPEAERKRWRVVRLDSYSDIPGEIMFADELTGEVKMKDYGGFERSYAFGSGAIKIIRK
jgi:hypothetical protein